MIQATEGVHLTIGEATMACAIQNSRQKKQLGGKAPWYAVWTDIDGKQHFRKVGKKADALEIARENERNAKRLGM